jgi:hypothetical protein
VTTTFDWKREAIDQLEWHWTNQLRPRLDGLTDDEYVWEPVPNCWNLRRREEATTPQAAGGGDLVLDYEWPAPDPPPVTTIAWRIGHVGCGCFGMRAASHFGAPAMSYETVEWPATAKDALAWLDDTYDRWMGGIKEMDDEAMARPVGPAEGPWKDSPFGALVLHINREAIHHGAEIALLRDLYAYTER